jgi:pimeloyl-ACP methyl ester carboxylesterase
MTRDIAKYQRFNSLDYRVFQADTVLDYLSEKVFPDLEKVIVYGHSEGAPVAAKLATVNEKITHVGFWAGNALPDIYDFMVMSSNAIDRGRITHEEGYEYILENIADFEDIAQNQDDTSYEDEEDYTNKRWWSYAEPPINHLLEIEVPLFVQVGGKDRSAPAESTFLIPLEFTRLGKDNLTYKICVECDHYFYVEDEKGKSEDKWEEIFLEFIDWTNGSPR